MPTQQKPIYLITQSNIYNLVYIIYNNFIYIEQRTHDQLFINILKWMTFYKYLNSIHIVLAL